MPLGAVEVSIAAFGARSLRTDRVSRRAEAPCCLRRLAAVRDLFYDVGRVNVWLNRCGLTMSVAVLFFGIEFRIVYNCFPTRNLHSF